MSASELQDQLGTQSFRDSYMNKLESWEELRRQGKRHRTKKNNSGRRADHFVRDTSGSGVFMAQGIAETA